MGLASHLSSTTWMGSDLPRWAGGLCTREAGTTGFCVSLASGRSFQGYSAAHACGSYDCGGVSMIPVQPTGLQKVTAGHLQRQAMLYVRQSTLHQVLENTESTARQYALRERAIAASAGSPSRSWSLIKIWANQEPLLLIVRDFNAWWPRSDLVMWDW